MSWDPYIDNLKSQCKGSCDKACIIGMDGSKWTTDAHPNAIKIADDEAKRIGQAFKSGDFTTFQASGVTVEGVKYQFLRGEEKFVLAKKKDMGALTLQKSKTAVVIGHVEEGKVQGDVNKGCDVIGEYLESLGY